MAALSLADPWSVAGLVARESLDAGAAFAGVLTSPSISGSFFLSRAKHNAPSASAGSFPVNYPNTWLRLRRTGNTLVGYGGMDGQTLDTVGHGDRACCPERFSWLRCVEPQHESNNDSLVPGFSEVTEVPSADTGRWRSSRVGQSSRLTSLVVLGNHVSSPERADGRSWSSLRSLTPWARLKISAAIGYLAMSITSFRQRTVLPGGGFVSWREAPPIWRVFTGWAEFSARLIKRTTCPTTTATIRLRNPVGAVFLGGAV